jgi:hypothetical protein
MASFAERRSEHNMRLVSALVKGKISDGRSAMVDGRWSMFDGRCSMDVSFQSAY